MGTLTVIVGYCGSGKSHLLRTLKGAFSALETLNEGFAPFGPPENFSEETVQQRNQILQTLRGGGHAAVTEGICYKQQTREAFTRYVEHEAPGTNILWVFFENDRATSDSNCRLHRNSVERPDPEGNVRMNLEREPDYSIPSDAIVLKVHQLPDS